MSGEKKSTYFEIFKSKNKTNDSNLLNNKKNTKKKLATFDCIDDDNFDQRPKTTKLAAKSKAIKIKSVLDLFESDSSEQESRIEECNFNERQPNKTITNKQVNKEYKIPLKSESKTDLQADSNKEKTKAFEYMEQLKRVSSKSDLPVKNELKEETNEKSNNALKEKSLNQSLETLSNELFKPSKPPLIESYFSKHQLFTSQRDERNVSNPKKFNRNQAIKELESKYKKPIETKSHANETKKPQQKTLEETLNTANRKDVNKAFEFITKLKSTVQATAKPTVEEIEEQEQEDEKRRILEANKESIKKIMAYVQKVNADKQKNPVKSLESDLIVLDSESDTNSQTRVSPKRKELEKDSDDENRDLNEDDEENKAQQKLYKPRRQYEYVAIDENEMLESQIDDVMSINLLNEAQIEYMVLRDINYYIDIFSGNCEHSWRHLEFKKYSKKSGNLLYSNAALSSYTLEQYTTAVTALQSIFCKKNNKCDEYIIKVLLPEALIKICMRIYQCSKEAAEDFLQHDNFKNNFKKCPEGSAIRLTSKIDLE